MLYVGTRKGLFEIDTEAATPCVSDAAFLGVPVTRTLNDGRDGTMYAALDHGHFGVKLHRRDAGGEWTEIAAPEYPPKPEGFVDICPMRQIERPWVTQLVWELAAGHPSHPGELWAGTIPGGLFRSQDRGASWELVRSLWDHPDRVLMTGGGYDYPGIHSVSVHPDRPDELMLSVSCGGTWFTDDGGETWDLGTGMRNAYMPPGREYSPVDQDPHRLARCAAVPEAMWVQHHNGIFRSTDGAASWTEIAGVPMSSFGFAVVAHPDDPQTAWFVPAAKDECRVPVDGRLVVTRTRDGGRSFDVLDRGLPPVPAYDLVYRHGFDLAPDGRTLAMGSTTGGVWISEDAGESWQCVSTHLPPVYAVRFIP